MAGLLFAVFLATVAGEAAAEKVRALILEGTQVEEQEIGAKPEEKVSPAGGESAADRLEWTRGKYTNRTRHRPERPRIPLQYYFEDGDGKMTCRLTRSPGKTDQLISFTSLRLVKIRITFPSPNCPIGVG